MKKAVKFSMFFLVFILVFVSFVVFASTPDHCSLCGSPDYHITSSHEYHFFACQNPLCTIQEYCLRDDYICDDPECGNLFARIHNLLDTSHSDSNCPYQ